ncbi:hypothetical protein WICPIJ_007359 [Wickerhamomyces pijperi]|uniref:Uncharacterized protein n=1 Tax=Wickerhamomyces pijperi TaxID=599730 RepID=A0A9P8Q0A8_WICPI|nr:hypothetical protein WICPIJ_007359 [Wickerhamomyces pijperi]
MSNSENVIKSTHSDQVEEQVDPEETKVSPNVGEMDIDSGQVLITNSVAAVTTSLCGIWITQVTRDFTKISACKLGTSLT